MRQKRILQVQFVQAKEKGIITQFTTFKRRLFKIYSIVCNIFKREHHNVMIDLLHPKQLNFNDVIFILSTNN